jgi:hypothetical protein
MSVDERPKGFTETAIFMSITNAMGWAIIDLSGVSNCEKERGFVTGVAWRAPPARFHIIVRFQSQRTE